jgi:hypothetical protein
MSRIEESIGQALREEPYVVCALWDDEEPRLTVAFDEVGRHVEDYRMQTRRMQELLLPLVASIGGSLCCGPEYGVMPTATGAVVYERGAS